MSDQQANRLDAVARNAAQARALHPAGAEIVATEALDRDSVVVPCAGAKVDLPLPRRALPGEKAIPRRGRGRVARDPHCHSYGRWVPTHRGGGTRATGARCRRLADARQLHPGEQVQGPQGAVEGA